MVAVVSGAALTRATLFRRRQLAWAGALQYRCVFDDAATNASNATLAFDDDGGGYANDDDDTTVSVVEYYGEEPDGGLGWVCRGGGADEGELALAQRGGGVRAWGLRWLRLDGLFRRGDGAFECAAGQRCARRSNPGHGYLSFDSFPAALLVTFQIAAVDGWADVMLLLQMATGERAALAFFVLFVVSVTWVMINFLVAAILDQVAR